MRAAVFTSRWESSGLEWRCVYRDWRDLEGEEGFRQREMETIRDLTAQQGIVLATGGGAILKPENRACLKAGGVVIYLRASISSILQRTSHDKNRPLLQTADPRARLEELARIREPLYLEVADLVVETGRPNVQSLVQTILTELERLETSVQAKAAPDA